MYLRAAVMQAEKIKFFAARNGMQRSIYSKK